MKKKVALLLAVIMVLSMLPMNMFGRSVTWQPEPNPVARMHTLTFGLMDLNGGSTQFASPASFLVDVTLQGGAAANTYFADAVGSTTVPELNVAFPLTVSNSWWAPLDAPQFTATITYTGARAARIIFTQVSGATVPGTAHDWLSVNLPIVANHNDAALRAVNQFGTRLIDDQQLTRRANAGVTISAGTVVNFQQQANLNPISIRENQQGALLNSTAINNVSFPDGSTSTTTAIRFIAPLDYAWNTVSHPAGPMILTTNLGNYGPFQDADGNKLNWGFVRPGQNNSLVLADGRHALDIWVSIPAATGNFAQFAETLRAERLVLVPILNRAPDTDTLQVEVEVGKAWLPAPQQVAGQAPAVRDTDFSDHSNWSNTVTVANRNPIGVSVATVGDDLVDIRSGRAAWSSVIRLDETTNGAFGTGINNVLNFTVDHPGVIITQVQWRWGRVGGGDGVPGNWNLGARVNETFALDPTNDNITPPTTGVNVGHLMNNGMTLFIPAFTPANAVGTGRIEVRLRLEVEAGFEWKYDSDEIVVEVSGTSLEEAVSLPVATVYDPITVALDGEPLLVEVGSVFNTIEPTEIADLVITEQVAGALPRGQVIRLEVMSLPEVFWQAPALMGTQVVVEGDSRLTLRQVGSSAQHVDFQVITQSVGDAPATIRFTNNMIMGGIFPGVQYVLAVSGVTGTENPGNAGSYRIDTATGQLSLNTAVGARGLNRFDAIPYFVQIVEFGTQHIGEDEAPGEEVPGVEVPVAKVLTMNPLVPLVGDVSGQTIDAPVIWRALDDQPNLLVGLVSVRAFAENFLGMEPDPLQQAEDGSGAFTRIAANGVEVILQVNNPNANVNGTIVDIATYVGFASGPAGTVTPEIVNDRMYLPLRFMVDVFGGQIIQPTTVGGTVTISH